MSTRNMAPKRDMGIIELMEMFPDEESAVKWVGETRWPDDRRCPHCRNIDTYRMKKSQSLPWLLAVLLSPKWNRDASIPSACPQMGFRCVSVDVQHEGGVLCPAQQDPEYISALGMVHVS